MGSMPFFVKMKLNEIKNNLFGLSDLKGLISENSFDESTRWSEFASKYPDLIPGNGVTYHNSPELRQALYDYWTNLGKAAFPSPEEFNNLTSDQKRKLNIKYLNGLRYVSRANQEMSDSEIIQPISDAQGDPNIQTPKKTSVNDNIPGNKLPVNVLYHYFRIFGGENIRLQGGEDEAAMKNYVDKLYSLAKDIYEKQPKPIKDFNETQFVSNPTIKVGNLLDPFATFLLLYYTIPRKSGTSDVNARIKEYLGNIKDDGIKDYVASLINFKESLSDKINNDILSDVGLSFDEPLTPRSFNTLRMVFFNYLRIEESISYLEKLINAGYSRSINLSRDNTVGGVLLSSLYVIKCSDEGIKNIKSDLSKSILGLDTMSFFRSFAYFARYVLFKKELVSSSKLFKMRELFGYPVALMFDPFAKINNDKIEEGIKKWASHTDANQNNPLKELFIPTFVTDYKNACPAEKIFITAIGVGTLLNENFERRLGSSGKNILQKDGMTVSEKINLLFSDADYILRLLEEDAEKRLGVGRIPKAIGGLRTMYKSLSGSWDSPLKAWNILYRDSNTKTQDEVYYFLSSISDENVKWRQEYNRYDAEKSEQEEGGLGRKSIDILGEKVLVNDSGEAIGNRKLCFEYQGEQHFRPINVRPADYNYALYTQMRASLLNKCGFRCIKGRNGREYYVAVGDFPSGNEIPLELKEKIIETYRDYLQLLQNKVATNPDYSNQVVMEGAGVRSGLNTASLKTIKVKEVIAYFKDVIERGAEDIGMFENPPLNGMIPYLCSPCRFADEILTAVDLYRDDEKQKVISARNMNGWVMAYVTPSISKSFTDDDYMYTVSQLASGNKGLVFQWNNEGKKQLEQFLKLMNFITTGNETHAQIISKLQADAAGRQEKLNERTNKKTSHKTLFEETVKEILNDNSR